MFISDENRELIRQCSKNDIAYQQLIRLFEQHHDVLNHIKDIVFQTDSDGNWVFLNPAWEKITGFTVAESLGTPYLNYIHPADRDQQHPEMRYRTKSGGYRHLTHDGQTIAGTVGVLRDITEQKQREETRYHQMFNTNRTIQLLIDPATGKIIDANPAAVDFYGYPLNVLKTMNIQQINSLSNQEIAQEMQHARLQKRNFFEFRHRLASGEIRDVNVVSNPIDLPEGHLLHSIIMDATGKREAEANREQSLNHLRFLNRTTLELIALPDEESVYTYIGEELCHLLDDEVVIIVNRNSPDGQMWITQGIYGLDTTQLGRTLKILGYSPVGQSYAPDLRLVPSLRNGHLVTVEGGLVELAKSVVPPVITRQLVKLLNLGEVYVIGLQKDDVFYAGVQVYMRGKRTIEHPELIEAFIHQASAALQHIQVLTSLRQSELRYRSLFEQSNDAVFILDIEGNHLQVNQHAADMLGYTLDEIVTLSYRDLVVPEQHHESSNVLQRLLAHEHILPYERTFRRKDGSLLRVELNVEIIWDHEGKPLHIQSIVRDITERRQMELTQRSFLEDIKALQEIHLELSEAKTLDALYYRMIELTHTRLGMDRIGLFRLDKTGEHLLGAYGIDPHGNLRDEHYYKEPLTPDHWTLEILNTPNRTNIQLDADIYEGGQIIGKGWAVGSALWNGERAIGYIVCDNFISGRPLRPYEGELVSILGTTFGHIIQRKEAEAALRESEQRYRLVVTTMTEGVVLQLKDGSIEACNPAAEQILGLTMDQMIGRTSIDPHWRAIHEDGTPFPGETHPAMMTLHTGEPLSNVIMGVHKPDSSLTWISINAQPIFYHPDLENHQPDAVLATFFDITEQKHARQGELELALEKERMRLLTTFLQNAAHEFKTPLSTINSSTYLMSKFDDLERRLLKADQILLQVKRITKLVDMLLTMVRLESNNKRLNAPVDLKMVLESVCQGMASTYGARPMLYCGDLSALPEIAGDMGYLTEAFQQILENAYQFTPASGAITVEIGTESDDVWLEVHDTGAGIAESALPHIFETFWRQDEAHTTPGFGLGLSIAQKIIEHHEGQITVQSEVGKGTCFRITLPIGGGEYPPHT